MKLAVVESVREGSALSKDFDRIFVMGESFEKFSNLYSLPALLDGKTSDQRDAYLDKLGQFLDLDALDKHYASVTRRIGVRARDIFSLYELNIYSRHTELSDLAKALVLLQQVENMTDVSLTSFLRQSKHINDFLRGSLSRESFQLVVPTAWRVRGLTIGFLRPMFEFLKGQAWLAFLTLSAVVAREIKLEGLQGRNLVIEPVGRPANEIAGGLSRYWRGLANLERDFESGVAFLHFSRGFLRDQAGKPVRHFRIKKALAACLFIQVAQAKVIWLRFSQLLRKHPSDEEKPYAAALRPAFERSIFGPSFHQSLWDHYQFRLFSEAVRPRSVFFLCEGQPWETALVLQGKRRNPVTQFFGVAHTAIRPWDLRYFRPPSWELGPLSVNQSAPDFLLVTSPFCYRRLTSFYGSTGRLKLVETLRYLEVDHNADQNLKPVIVIALTYTASENACLLKIAKQLEEHSALPDMIRVRSHPLRPHDMAFKRFDPSSERSVSALCDATSTVGIELSELDVPTIFLHVGSLPNMSPLADVPEFARDFSYMSDGLVEMVFRRAESPSSRKGFSYYSRDLSLQRWRSLIQEHRL